MFVQSTHFKFYNDHRITECTFPKIKYQQSYLSLSIKNSASIGWQESKKHTPERCLSHFDCPKITNAIVQTNAFIFSQRSISFFTIKTPFPKEEGRSCKSSERGPLLSEHAKDFVRSLSRRRCSNPLARPFSFNKSKSIKTRRIFGGVSIL